MIESLKGISDQDQAEIIVDRFCRISQEYEPLKDQDFIAHFDPNSLPCIDESKVRKKLAAIKTNKSVPKGDIPPKLIKFCAAELASPLCHIINSMIKQGKWSKIYKKEIVTPIPKVFPPKSPEELRSISGLLTFNKIAESIIAELIIEDISSQLDPSQYANQKGISLEHYLVKMLHKILSDTDKQSKEATHAIIATLFDWKDAFPRQCHKLGIEAFRKCGVRESLIPVLGSYLQDRSMVVKWNGTFSKERKLHGGGAQGSILGLWEYLIQSNDNANCVSEDYRFKFVDDLSTLEKINLLTIGILSHNFQNSVPSDLPMHNQVVPAENLESQRYINEIQAWTKNKKMILNQKKTKVMIFNFSEKHQFTTRLQLEDENLEIINKTKLLGVQITDDLRWEENTKFLVKKAFGRLELLRRVANFSTSEADKKVIYIQYIRSILEQSCVVWHSSLTKENSDDLERVQKCALRIILGNRYTDYENGLKMIGLETLEQRRINMCRKFALKSLKDEKTKSMFPLRKNKHGMKKRKDEKFAVQFARTKRLQNSAIIYMQKELNNIFSRNKRTPG